MFGVPQILVSPPLRAGAALVAAVLLAGCGQKGPLFLPTGEAAANRASLPQTLTPSTAVIPSGAASVPGGASPQTGTAEPVRGR